MVSVVVDELGVHCPAQLMAMREELEFDYYTVVTGMLAEMDSILLALQPPDQSTPIPLYSGVCNNPESHRVRL